MRKHCTRLVLFRFALISCLFGLLATAQSYGRSSPSPSSATSQKSAELPGHLLDKVIAVVNDQPILLSALSQQVKQISAGLQAEGTPLPERKVLEKQVLSRLIIRTIELQLANRQGIEITKSQLNRVLADIAKRNHLTLAELPAALRSEGESFSAFRRTIHHQLIVRQLEQQDVAANITVTPAELNEYLQREKREKAGDIDYKLAQILIPFPPNAGPKEVATTLSRAKNVEKQLKDGANFASLAAAKSSGPNALKGGVIGWRKGADLPTMFANAVPQMSLNGVSSPIEGPGGYHIIKLLAVRHPNLQETGTQYHIERILIAPNPIRNNKQCQALAAKLRKDLESGKTSFSKLAKQYSDDPNTAGNGGDLGWVPSNTLPPPIAKSIASIPQGKPSAPIRTSRGWNLIEVLGKRKHSEGDAGLRNAAYQAIFKRKLSEQLAEFKRTIRQQAYVHIIDPSLSTPSTPEHSKSHKQKPALP